MPAYVKWWVRDRITGRTLKGQEIACPEMEKLDAPEKREALRRLAGERALGLMEYGARLVDHPDAR